MSKLLNPREMEISLNFHNYKLLKDEKFNLKGSVIYFVKGPNGTGKTSFLNALIAHQQMKDNTPIKVTKGEEAGRIEVQIPGSDGSMYTVVSTFDDSKIKFIVLDEDGNKINKVTQMREIFNYNHIDAREFISWSATAEGRRKQKEHILKLLPGDLYDAYMLKEAEESKLFEQRTTLNRSVSSKEAIKNRLKLNSDEKEKIAKAEEVEKLLKQIESETEELTNSSNKRDEIKKAIEEKNYLFTRVNESLKDSINREIKEVSEIDEQIKMLQQKKEGLIKNIDQNKYSYKQEELVHREEIEKLEKQLKELPAADKETEDKISVNKNRLANGQVLLSEITELKAKLANYNEVLTEYNTEADKASGLTEQINNLRKEKSDIFQSANLPVKNISFDEEGYIEIDGFRFDPNQICESDAILVVAQLLCTINENPIQVLGDASLLDNSKLKVLSDIAEKNGKVMFIDEVDRDIDKMVVVGYDSGEPIQSNDITEDKLF